MLSFSQCGGGGKKEMEEEEKQSETAAGGHRVEEDTSPFWLLRDVQSIQAWTLACLIPCPRPKVPLCSLAGPPQSLLVNTYAHVVGGGGIQPLTPPAAASIRHTGCKPCPTPVTEPLSTLHGWR